MSSPASGSICSSGGSGVYLHVRDRHYLADLAGKWSEYRHLHFHGFQYRQGIPDGNRVAGLHGNGNDYCRRRRVHYATVIPIDGMRHAVHFDTVSQSLNGGDDMEAPAERGEPVFKLTQAVDLDIDAGSVHFNTVAVEVDAEDLQGVGVSPMEQLNSPALPHSVPAVARARPTRRTEFSP